MLLFNYKKEFIGIDEIDLTLLGFKTLSELQNEVDDFADLFVKKPGFIHNFKHVNWIDFVECADSPENAKAIININAKNFQCLMSVTTLYLTDEPTSKAYTVHLQNIKELTQSESQYVATDLLEKSQPEPTPIKKETTTLQTEGEEELFTSISTDTPLDLDFSSNEEILEDDLKISFDEPEKVEQKLPIPNEVFDNGYVYDPNIASEELGLPVDLIEEFIEDFVAQAKDFKKDLYKAVDNADQDNLKILSHKLKGVAANLRIEDAFESLSIINSSSNNTTVQEELDNFYKIILKLAGGSLNTRTQDEVIPEEITSLELDDFELELKEDELEPSFEDEKIMQPHKNIPELADDDFLLHIDEDEKITEDDIKEDLFELDLSEEILEIETDLTDEIFNTPNIAYSKEDVANDIGMNQENFNELLGEYFLEANALSNSIKTAIETNNKATWKHLAMNLKGMSDNMRIHDFTKELEILINTEDSSVAKEANTQVVQCIKQLSKSKD